MNVTGINVYRAMIGDGILLCLTHDVTVDGKQTARHEYVRLTSDTAGSLADALLTASETDTDAVFNDGDTVTPTGLGRAIGELANGE